MTRRDTMCGLALFANAVLPKARNVHTIAFHYAARASLSDLEYLARFDLIVVGGIIASDQITVLKGDGAEIVLYRWASGLYPGEATIEERGWEDLVIQNAATWLLSSKPVGGGAAMPGKIAYWYDFGNKDFVAAFTDFLSALLETNHYRGVFLDTLGEDSLPSTCKINFRERHRDIEYDRAQGNFLTELRRKIGPEAIIFTNQGYRNPDTFLPEADWDLIESSASYLKDDGSVAFRPWFRRGAEWDSIRVPLTRLVVPAAQRYPNVRFAHIDYSPPESRIFRTVVRYCQASALLWNHVSFVAAAGIQKPLHSWVYFEHWGLPIEPYRENQQATVVWRRFERGIVAINSSDRPYRVSELQITLPAGPKGFLFRKSLAGTYITV